MGYDPVARLGQRHGYATPTTPETVSLNQDRIEVNVVDERADLALPKFHIARMSPFKESDVPSAMMATLGKPNRTEDTDLIVPPELVPRYIAEHYGSEKRSLEEHHDPEERSRWHFLWDSKWVYRWDREEPTDLLSVWVEEYSGPTVGHVLFSDFHTVNAHFKSSVANNWYRSIPGWEDDIARSLRTVFPEVEEAEVTIRDTADGKAKTGYIEFPDKVPLEVDQFGDGFRHAFKILACLRALAASASTEDPGILLWEEPELFAHPATLSRLLKEVVNIVSDSPIQVFVSTQSLDVIAWLANYLESEDARKAENATTYILDLVSGVLKVKRLVGRGIGSWLRLVGDPRMVGQDEMESPLLRFISGRKQITMAAAAIYVFAEGATERAVGKILYRRELLSHKATPSPTDWGPFFGPGTEGFHNMMQQIAGIDIRTCGRALLIFDQETRKKPSDAARDIGHRLGIDFAPMPTVKFDNLFEYLTENCHVVLHVSNAKTPDIDGLDFDGYLLQLLQSHVKAKIARRILNERIAPLAQDLIENAEIGFSDLMKQKGYPWTHSKSWLYAYVTALQRRKSHAYFAEEIVKRAPEEELRKVFAPLIAAWNALCEGIP